MFQVPSAFLKDSALRTLESTLAMYSGGRSIDIVQAQPKIDKLKTLLADHMARHVRARKSTRAMVFCNQRDTVTEIVRQLELMAEEAVSCSGEGRAVRDAVATVAAATDAGLADVCRDDWAGAAAVRAHSFIGQAKTSSGAGLNQEQQADVVQRFRRWEIRFRRKTLLCSVCSNSAPFLSVPRFHCPCHRYSSGDINTLVSTSIGEEGLDVGEVDLLVQFDQVTAKWTL